MKFIKQFAVILAVSFFGEILARFVPLPVPASIYGLLLMFIALFLHIFPVEAVKETSAFLLDIMPLMFIPPAVAVLENIALLKGDWWKLLLIALLSTVAVMAVSGAVTQFIIRLENKNRKQK